MQSFQSPLSIQKLHLRGQQIPTQKATKTQGLSRQNTNIAENCIDTLTQGQHTWLG
jgi:hypothetical protein